MNPIRAVTFDVGGTWIKPWPSVGAVYAQTVREFGITVENPELLTRGFIQAWEGRAGFDYSRGAWRQMVDEAFLSVPARPPDNDCFDAIYSRFAEPGCWRVFEDVRPAIGALAMDGCKLGLISNWDERLRPLLQKLELLTGLDAVVISHEVGDHKPGRRIFNRAVELLGVSPEEVLHVGDSMKEDVNGALAAGFQALLLDRGAPSRGDAISSLAEVPGLVRHSRNRRPSCD